MTAQAISQLLITGMEESFKGFVIEAVVGF